jgi:energy-coupling factor transporter ATP-binding protein EcfA2
MPEKKFIGHLTLELRNIACFREFSVDLRSGEVTEVTGGNGRGKSTLLTCLKNNVTGKPVSFPDWLVTDFENRGTVKASIDDRVTVKRDLTAGESASALALYDEYNEPLNGGKKQMEALRALFGDGTYLNPVEVVHMRPEDRTKAVAAALPIDPRTAADALAAITGRPVEIKTREDIFPSIQRAHDSLYELRKQKKKDYKDADAQADGVLSFLPAEWLDTKGNVPPPKEPEPLGDIYDRKRAAEVRNGERAQLMQDIGELEEFIQKGDEQTAGDELRLSSLRGELQGLGTEEEDEAALEEQIRQLQAQLFDMKTRNGRRRTLANNIATASSGIEQNKATLETYRARLKQKQDREFELGGLEDVTALQARIDAHEDQMTIYREALQVYGERNVRYQQVDELRQKSAALYAEWEELERKVKAIDNLPIRLLDGVPVPIPGMQILGQDIYLPDGEGDDMVLRPFDAFGDADKLRFAADMAMELAPVNILILDGIEKCDEERRMLLYRKAAERDFIVFSTLVTKGPLAINHYTREQLAGDCAPTDQDRTNLPEVSEN